MLVSSIFAARLTPSSYVAIPSLPQYLAQMQPVINDRLAAAKDRIGLPTLQLRIATYSSSYTGCILSIESGRLASVQPRRFTGEQIVAFSDPTPTIADWDVPNVIGPYGGLVQLLMGYAGLDEIRWIVPDLSVREDVRLVVDAAFPVLRSVSFFYG